METKCDCCTTFWTNFGGAEPSWHRILRAKRSEARRLVHTGALVLQQHRGSAVPLPVASWLQMDRKNPYELAAEVLEGPRKPEWSCPHCYTDSNWASRIVCRCGKGAPRSVSDKAKAAAKAAADTNGKGGGKGGKGGDGRWASGPMGSHNIWRGAKALREGTLAQQLRCAQQELKDLRASPWRAEQADGDDKQPGENTDESSLLLGEIREHEASLAKTKSPTIKKFAEEQLLLLRAKLQESKPPDSSHEAVARKLKKKIVKRDKLEEAFKKTNEELEEVQKKLATMLADKATLDLEIVDLQNQFASTAERTTPEAFAARTLGLPTEILECHPDIKAMQESEAFIKLQRLLLDQVKGAGARAGRTNPSATAARATEEADEDDSMADAPPAGPEEPVVESVHMDAMANLDKTALEEYLQSHGFAVVKRRRRAGPYDGAASSLP